MEEIWKNIKGYEGLYQVSNLGRIKSLKRKVYAGNGKMRWQYERIMSSKKTNGNGYNIVSLNKNGKSQNRYVHRLVAEMFIENNNKYSKRINRLDEENNILETYPSISEASRKMAVSVQTISKCLNGKQKHSAGYKWKYADG